MPSLAHLMESSRRRVFWAAAATVVGVLLAFAPAVVGVRTLSHRDTDRLYAPVRTLVVEALREGRLPLWNPYEGLGKPLFAEGIHSVLHPLSLAAAALAPSSIDFLILAYLVAAALGAFLLARTLGASPHGAAAAGLAFALSGFSASMTGNLVFLAGLSTLPWLLAAARSAGAGAPWGTVATALATACAFFTGDAQVALVGIALGALLAADAGGRRGAARAFAGMAVGVLLAGVQILATSELLPLTARAAGLEGWEKTQWALHPARLLEWIVPGLFRGPPGARAMTAAGALVEQVFAESVYLGAPLLVAAALGGSRAPSAGGRRTRLLLAGSLAVLLWLALGHHAGAQQALDLVPVWSSFRYSEKLMAPLALCACTLAAQGVDGFAGARLSKAWTRALAATAVAAAAALVALLLAPAATGELASRLLGDEGSFYRATLTAGLPHLLFAVGALLAIDRLRAESVRGIALTALVALAPAVAVYQGAHLGSPDARAIASPLRLPSDSPAPRLAQPAEGVILPDEQRRFVDVEARQRSSVLAPSVNVASRVDAIDQYGGLGSRRLASLSTELGSAWPRFARRFGLTHVAVPVPHDLAASAAVAQAVQGGQLVQRDEGLRFELWAVPHRPWAFFAQGAASAPTADDARRGLRLLAARGDDATVVVEAATPPPTSRGIVLRRERTPEAIVVDADAPGPALLVVQDAYWPGWRAAIDGQPVELLATDYLVRSVRWPPGRHRLEMVYDPPELRVGLAISGLGAVLVLLLGGLALRRTRRAAREGGPAEG